MGEECLSRREVVNITILGDHKVGKTTFIKNYLSMGLGVHEQIKITTEPEIHEIHYIDGIQNIKFVFVDTPGFRSHRPLSNYHVKTCDVVLLVFDMSDERSFYSLADWICHIKSVGSKENRLTILMGIEKDKKLVSNEKAQAFADRHHFVFLPSDIEEPMEEIYRQIINHRLAQKRQKRFGPNCSLKPHCRCSVM